MVNQKRLITAEDLYNFNFISDCQLSPDGQHIIYPLHRVDRKTEKKYSNLWVVPTDKGAPQQFTYGDHSETNPRWSPDGTKIAFISNRGKEEQLQLYIIPFSGGEARPLTDLKGSFDTFQWSPDGKKIVFTFRKKDKEEIEREEDEQKKKLGVVARRITRVFFKEDGSGFLPKERWHLWMVNSETGEATQLTDSEIYDEREPSWSPDSKEIVFTSNRSKDPDMDPEAIDVFVMSAQGGDFRKVETPPGIKVSPQFSPDGKWIAYCGHEGKKLPWRQVALWVVRADGSEKAINLTEKTDFDVFFNTINDIPGGLPPAPPTWSRDSETIYVLVSYHGNTVLKAVSLDTSMTPIIESTGVVGLFTFDKEHTTLTYLCGTMKDPVQIWMHSMATGKSRQLTNVNEFLKSVDLGEVEEMWFKGASDNDLHGWIIKPPNFDEKRKYPSILEIHGGPHTQYGNFFMHEFFYLAASGYVVYFCNPRGSLGYGEAHSKAIWNRWGTVDYDDLMAWADFVSEKPYIDKERMGVTGGSYGGYMTNWIIGHTDRFKAAVTQRSVSNLISMYGSSDFNWSFEDEFGNEPPWENFENYWKQSPLKYIGNCKTPTLISHSEQDLRADIEQGLQIFVALKRMGVDTEMVIYPEEPHGLSRTGRTDRRIVRLNSIRGWFDQYLK